VQSTGVGPGENDSSCVVGTEKMANTGVQPDSGMNICIFAYTIADNLCFS